jgi:hypothetical protein
MWEVDLMASETNSPEVIAPNVRRLNVGDALILIAALCLTLSGIRDRVRTLPARGSWWIEEYRRFRAEAASVPPMSDEDFQFTVRSLEYYLSDEFQAWLTSALLALTCAQILIRLRYPRPEWRTLFRQPGFVACCAAALGLGLDTGWIPLARFENLHYPYYTSLMVLFAWAVLYALRLCLAEKSWIDRLGRLTGIGWIISGLYSLIEQYYLW